MADESLIRSPETAATGCTLLPNGRLEAYRTLWTLARNSGMSLKELFTPRAERMRFKLSSSATEISIPVCISSELRHSFFLALTELLSHLVERNRDLIPDGEYDGFALTRPPTILDTPPPVFSPPAGVVNPRLEAVFSCAALLHPFIDSGVIAGWLRKEGAGRNLLSILSAVMRKSLDESSSHGAEETAYITMLYLRNFFALPEDVKARFAFTGAFGNCYQAAIACGVSLLLWAACEQALADLRERDKAVEARTATLLRCLSNPVFAGRGVRSIAPSCQQIYGLEYKLIQDAFPYDTDSLVACSESVDALVDEVASRLRGNRFGQSLTAQQISVQKIRQAIFGCLRESAWGSGIQEVKDLRQSVYRLWRDPAQLHSLLGRKEQKKNLCRRLSPFSGWRAVAALVEGFDPRKPLTSIGLDEAGAFREIASSMSVLLFDSLACGAAEESASVINDRGDFSSLPENENDYDAGKLYLLSREERPLLKQSRRINEMGHLFIDLKDFTRRTALLKEDVMADFLAREFYKPVLAAAREFFKGMGHLMDLGGIYLNNIPGDALSFSGDVSDLFLLARKMRKILDNYSSKLAAALTDRRINQLIEAEVTQHAQIALPIEEKMRQLASQPGGTQSPAYQALWKQDQAVAAERDARILQLKGEDLRAGLFISFGSPPRIIEFDDDVWGKIRISIAEKINESARGTARDQKTDHAVRQAHQAACEAYGEGQKPVNPFRVFVLEPEGSIYNVGDAMSGDALRAYLGVRASREKIIWKGLSWDAVHPDIGWRFFLPRGRLDVAATIDTALGVMKDVFVYAGKAVFKGFEKKGETEVWEILPQQSPFVDALVKLYLPAWLEEARKN